MGFRKKKHLSKLALLKGKKVDLLKKKRKPFKKYRKGKKLGGVTKNPGLLCHDGLWIMQDADELKKRKKEEFLKKELKKAKAKEGSRNTKKAGLGFAKHKAKAKNNRIIKKKKEKKVKDKDKESMEVSQD